MLVGDLPSSLYYADLFLPDRLFGLRVPFDDLRTLYLATVGSMGNDGFRDMFFFLYLSTILQQKVKFKKVR